MKNLEAALNKYGLTVNKWQRLLPTISIIYMDQDMNIYIGKDEIFNFDTNSGLLKMYKGKELEKGEALESSYTPTMIFDLDSIGGFISTSTLGPACILH